MTMFVFLWGKLALFSFSALFNFFFLCLLFWGSGRGFFSLILFFWMESFLMQC
uniref:Uncharacterized protein n=1 Tax=Rhizophora mucronata TaxID=61149 RepID=A0A2P2PGT0_RHIMU